MPQANLGLRDAIPLGLGGRAGEGSENGVFGEGLVGRGLNGGLASALRAQREL